MTLGTVTTSRKGGLTSVFLQLHCGERQGDREIFIFGALALECHMTDISVIKMIISALEIQAPELSEPESVELELGSCCSDLDKQVSDKICWTRKRQFEIPFRL